MLSSPSLGLVLFLYCLLFDFLFKEGWAAHKIKTVKGDKEAA